MSRPWLLAERNYSDLKLARPEVVVLPFGATEPHNLHLPYGTDVYEADALGEAACRKAYEHGVDVACLPTVPYGTETNQQAFPLSMNLMPSTLLTILRDLLRSIETSGVRKCLILNSHGGNDFKGHLRELYGSTTVQLFLCNWYQMIADVYDDVFEHPDDHAGEMETSILLALRPELVKLELADDGTKRTARFEAVRNGWVQLTRPWDKLTTNSGAGYPHAANAEKGTRLLEIASDRLAGFLIELAQSPLDDDFPFETQQA